MPFIQEKIKIRGLTVPNDEAKYQILSIDEIFDKEINKVVKQIMEIVGDISAENCQKLLFIFNWNFEKLLEKFSEADSFDDFLKNYQIDLSIPLTSEDIVNSFIHSNPLFKFCPNKSKNCKKVVKIKFSEIKEIICECNFEFCFKCDEIPHSPFPCILVKEWLKQCEEFERIFENNDVICPKCFETYKMAEIYYEFFCYNCNELVNCDANKLIRPSNNSFYIFGHDSKLSKPFLDYKFRIYLKQRFEGVLNMKTELKNLEDVEAMVVICKIVKDILEKTLLLPAFSFFLDKEYLTKYSSTANASLFDFCQNDLKTSMNKINFVQDRFDVFSDYFFRHYEKELDNTLDDLHFVQKRVDKLLKFVYETKEWIFKLPEIQEVFDNRNEESNKSNENWEDEDESMKDDDIMDFLNNDGEIEDEVNNGGCSDVENYDDMNEEECEELNDENLDKSFVFV